ncbi:MAG: hypothetical protein AAF985_20645 [Bacteroidota bacterium]
MKRLANLKNILPAKSKLNKRQALNLKGGADKRRSRQDENTSGGDSAG